MSLPVDGTGGNPAWWATLIVLCLILLAPLTLADVPPLLDYPNHLARLYVLAFGPADPVLSRFYAPHWGIIPNLALDLTVPPLLRLFPVHIVGRAVIGFIFLLPVLGAAAYHRALTGRLSYWSLTGVLFAYNAASLRGFLNFIASVGLALLAAAAWVAWREPKPARAVAIAVLGAVVLFFSHLTGLLFFAVLIGAHDAAALRTERRLSIWLIFRRGVVLACVLAAPVALYAASDLGQMQGVSDFRSVAGKAASAMMPVINYFWPLDLLTAALCLGVPALCLARRWCIVPFQAGLALGILTVLFLALPHAFKATYDLDTRFIVMVSALAPAALVPVALPRRAALAMGAGFLLLFLTRMTVVGIVWHAWAGELAAFRAVIAPVRPGDVVLTVRLPRGPDPSPWTTIASPRRLSDGTVTDAHLSALLLIEHRAWWPFLFDIPSQQPIETREPFRTVSARIDASPDPIALLARNAAETRIFTHVLVLGSGPGLDQIDPEGLERLTRNHTAALFAIPRAP